MPCRSGKARWRTENREFNRELQRIWQPFVIPNVSLHSSFTVLRAIPCSNRNSEFVSPEQGIVRRNRESNRKFMGAVGGDSGHRNLGGRNRFINTMIVLFWQDQRRAIKAVPMSETSHGQPRPYAPCMRGRDGVPTPPQRSGDRRAAYKAPRPHSPWSPACRGRA